MIKEEDLPIAVEYIVVIGKQWNVLSGNMRTNYLLMPFI